MSDIIEWEKKLIAHMKMCADIEEALALNGLPRLVWYSVLSAVSKRGGSAKPFELVKDLSMDQSTFSRMSGQMVQSGLFTVKLTPLDGRKRILVITDIGEDVLLNMKTVISEKLEDQT